MDWTTYHSPNWGSGTNYSKWEHNGGGVRVKEIRDYDPLSGKTMKRDFYYKLYSADSTHTCGQLVSPVYITSIENVSGCNCSYHKLYQQSSYPLAADGNAYVVYPEVRTIDSAGGKTDRIYNYSPDVTNLIFPLVPCTDNSNYRNKLVFENIFDQSGNLLKKSVHNLGLGTTTYQTGVRVKAYWWLQGITTWFETNQGGTPSLSACNYYSAGLAPVFPSQEIDSIFSGSSAQVLRTDLSYTTYNNMYFLQKKTTYINSKRTKEQTYKYAFTSNSAFNLGLSSADQTMKTTLQNNNFLQPLEIDDSIRTGAGSATFLTGYKYKFANFNGSKVHLNAYLTYTTPTDSTETDFTAYDAFGNCTETYKKNDVKTVTLWGYRGLYPVAKVVGSSYSTVAGFVNLSVINNPSSDSAMRVELNKIRTGLAGSIAQVTTYTYSPGWGMTSMTDPAGRISYYEYDVHGRLNVVRDLNRNIIKKYDYKLNNPQ